MTWKRHSTGLLFRNNIKIQLIVGYSEKNIVFMVNPKTNKIVMKIIVKLKSGEDMYEHALNEWRSCIQ